PGSCVSPGALEAPGCCSLRATSNDAVVHTLAPTLLTEVERVRFGRSDLQLLTEPPDVHQVVMPVGSDVNRRNPFVHLKPDRESWSPLPGVPCRLQVDTKLIQRSHLSIELPRLLLLSGEPVCCAITNLPGLDDSMKGQPLGLAQLTKSAEGLFERHDSTLKLRIR